MNDTMDLRAAKQALLTQWEKERDELNLLISRLKRELGVPAGIAEAITNTEPVPLATLMGVGTIDVNAIVQPGDFFGMTQVKAAVEFLKRTNKQTCSLQTIGDALFRGKAIEARVQGAAALRNLGSLLSKSDEFISVARGRWGLAEWYPNRAKKKQREGEQQEESTEAKVAANA